MMTRLFFASLGKLGYMECYLALVLLGVLVCFLWQLFGSGCRIDIVIF